ncbi:acyl-CoA dehydrogenase [Herbaspirillum rubrisubalbicans]|uniref:Acyl-CoA dehydrogenase n=2 Tax=Herbaspirillum rubrisubalbicans TaxID=80842 RepID=A0ABX9C778_9BURK|nr:acyl-CoA dehydrogenase family protein [Herbaspirillum rubrisubalbicans]MCP1572926.1 alkylation response protein AidB-like acyl-CoA dehydrogenase [Herbaspirillum rubrisubalbicans]NQE47260.1 acyl-CoA dehydrogenase [Herbaspirillum rubrisubalbicans]QJQ01490.1 acyl-CoA dehydrogenase [Herbaspirillum rubrisubalbicans Os34]RAM66787.1 acyl-CoA dehydrogenase [Herbaspirillum rubrisubalbicans]RAN47446.1 acyl-CoA dehydrogenase [Herbaspirillum rubrisubalbicans]
MTYQLNEDQVQIQDLVRRVAREKVAPRADQIDRSGDYPHDMYALLKELGLFTLPFPERYGGANSMLSSCIAVEELGRVCYNTGYLLVVQWTPFGAILEGGTEEQKERLLPGLASGELRGALSLTEPQSGSDVAGITTTARRVDGGYVLNGAKIWCTNSHIADFILVAAKTVGADGTPVGINLFIVERDVKGLTIGREEDKMGARGVPSCPLFFDDAFIAEANRLGPEGGQGFKVAMEALNTSRPIVAARAVGIAQGAIDHAVKFIEERAAFGQTIAGFQGVRWMIADMVAQTEAARQLVYRAASLVDSGVTGRALAPTAAMAKMFASDVAMKVATDAVQLFGAAGISNEYPINRYFRDAKVVQIIEGTNQIQRNIIADSVLGRIKKK